MVSTGKKRVELGLKLGSLVVLLLSVGAEAKCRRGCDLALASYYVWKEWNFTFMSEIMHAPTDYILSFNSQVPSKDRVQEGIRLNVPFSCDCIKKEFLGHVFSYSVRPGDTYGKVANKYYSNLTTEQWLQETNSYDPYLIPDVNAQINVTVNCSCGNKSVSNKYGLFVTYPLRPGENLSSIASDFGLTSELLQQYNPNSDFSSGSGLVYIPGKDKSGSYPPLKFSSKGISVGAIVGISIAAAGLAAALLMVVCIYVGVSRRKKMEASLLPASEDCSIKHENVGGASPGLTGITVDKSVEFSYEELAEATNDFNMAHKIGQGGFGAVYYAELRGEKAAIKKMDMQASKAFLAELNVLTRVHHLNLVRLIGFCVQDSLFLVYEFIENGNLSQHLRGSEREPLPWATRVQIALDSARGLEYIHEHTVPVYIHRDIKSANILIDKNFHGKVADFGLAKLTEVGGGSLQTRLVGTFGYMPPEYARYGDVSPKVDVYAFGVVLYELISAKEAVVKNGSVAESKGLVAMFEDVLNQPDPREDLRKLVDPRLGDNYPIESVRKMAHLAKACTQENPQLRPSMRSIVVALMTLSSSTDDWDVGPFYENQSLMKLMSGR